MSLHDSIQPTEAGPPSAVERKLGSRYSSSPPRS
jgi:hypothetical protein